MTTPADVRERTPLHRRQLRLYAATRLYPDVVVADAIYAIEWPGLDPARFAVAWQRLLDECDALRTVVEEGQNGAQLRVRPRFAAPVETVDLRGAGADAPDAWLAAHARCPLPLERTAFATALLRTADDRYLWYLNVHHVFADAAAVELIVRRVVARHDDPDAVLPAPPPLPDADAGDAPALRQHEPPPPLVLYGTAPSGTAQERIVLRFDPAVGHALDAAATQLEAGGVGPAAARANVVLAAFAIYLTRVAAAPSATIALTAHRRRNERERETIGLFLELQPIEVAIGTRETMHEIASRIGTTIREHREARGAAPAFSGPLAGALYNFMQPFVTLPSHLRLRRLHPGHGVHAIALSVLPPRDDRRLELWLDVNAAVVLAVGADAIAAHLRTVVSAALTHPSRPVAELPFVDERERRALLDVVPLAAPRARAHELIAARSAGAADALAIIAREERLTYRELDERSDRIAAALARSGARPGARIAIALPRSPAAVVAMLGVMKSGAAFLPLDPALPELRRSAMLADAAPVAVVTDHAWDDAIPSAIPRVLAHRYDAALSAPPRVVVHPDDVAYVIYTSGSTGTPKGVLATHRGLDNYLAWRRSYFPLTAADRSLHRAALGFDDAVWEVLEPLIAGACVVIAPPDTEADARFLAELLEREQITAACAVPTQLRALAAEPAFARCTSLRRLTTGGEVLPAALSARIRAALPHVALYNGYGTTETTIASTFRRCGPADGDRVPIGTPIANTRVVVLGPAGELLPTGVPGEIAIGGAGVARGYLDRPALTAERFVPDPFARDANARLYRTGDRGRRRRDGAFEFLGRTDEQVKVRGVRIELAEIEAALAAHEAVASAAAAVTGEDAASVVAAVVPRAAPPAPEALRAFLTDRLPPAVLPSRIAVVAALPQTASGKIDRAAVARLASSTGASPPAAPHNEREALLLAIWERTLERAPIGVHDDFFALGGDSLRAVRVAAEVTSAFGRRIPPAAVFEAPTVAALSLRLSHDRGGPRSPLVELQSGTGIPLVLVHQVNGDLFGYRELVRALPARRLFGLEAVGLHGDAPLLSTIEAMAARYIEALRAAGIRHGFALAGHSAGGLIAFEMARMLAACGERVAWLAVLDTDATIRTRPTRLDRLRFAVHRLRRRSMRQRLPAPARPTDPAVAAIDAAVRAYVPRPYDGPLHVVRAREREPIGNNGRSLGWRRLARSSDTIDAPGDHVSMLGDRLHAEAIAAKIAAALDALERRGPWGAAE